MAGKPVGLLRSWIGRLVFASILAWIPPAVSAQTAGWIQTEKSGRIEKRALENVRVVTSRALNVRPDPSTGKPPVATIEHGDVVRQIGTTFNTMEGRAWVQVDRPDGSGGWVAAQFLEPLMPS